MTELPTQPASNGPRLFYGWIMLGVAIGMAAASMPGQTVLVSLWKEPLREELGLSLVSVSLAYTIGTICAGLPLPWVGRIADRLGLRFTVGVVALGFVASLLMLRFTTGIITLGVGFFLVRFLGQGSLSMLSGHTIAMWFERKLGKVHALLAVAGFAAASAVMPIPTAWMLEHLGWRNALACLAAFVALLTLPWVLLVFRNKPEDIGQHLDGDPGEHETHDVLHGGPAPIDDPAFTVKQAAATPAYWILMAHLVMTGFVGTVLIFHMPAMLQQAGLEGSPAQAALAIQAWPIVFGLATLLVGPLADRFHPAKVLPASLVLMALGTLICLGATRGMASETWTVPLMGVGMGVYGASQAVIIGVANPTIARFFGRTHHGAIRGTVATGSVIGTGAGPYLIAAAVSLSGDDFTPALLVCAATTLPLGVAASLLKRPPIPAVRDLTPDHDEVDPTGPGM